MQRIAVHIVTYNSAAVIEACLQALRAQDCDFDICIVDNASTDSTVELLTAAGFHVITSAANVGYAAAHNLALAQTRSEYVLTLNPDVLLQPGYLSAMTAALDSHPEVGSAAGCLLRVERIDDPPHAIDSVGLFMRRNRRQGLLLENAPPSEAPAESRAVFGPDGAAAFYRRAMLDDIAVNGDVFDQDFFMHKEDVDLCWRAQLAGWKSLYVPEARAHHIRTFRPGRRERVDRSLRRYAVRNRYLLLLKNEIRALFLRDLLWIVLYDAAILGYLLLREPASLAALVDAWKLRKRMLEKRRIIHAKRRVTPDEMAVWFEARP
jgi:GT2 family glycosyltransferase